MMRSVARKQVLVQLDDAQVAALDRIAGDGSRSEVIRRAVDLYVEAATEAADDARYAQAYQRLPEDLQEFAGVRAIAVWPET